MPITLSGDGIISGLTATGISAVQNLPAGSVLQVVSSAFTTQVSTASTTYVTSGLALSITPKFVTSKILINFTGTQYGNGDTTVYRGATNLALSSADGFTRLRGNADEKVAAINYLDSPASTSSVTYTLYIKAQSGGSGSYWINISPTTSTITLMEIAA